ncbi:grainyhead-like protein 1 homolog isoform X2 [Tubulanus polymorphus]
MALLHEYKNLPPIGENEIKLVANASRDMTPSDESEKSELLLLNGSSIEKLFIPDHQLTEEELHLYREHEAALAVAQLSASEQTQQQQRDAGDQIRRALSEKIMRRKFVQMASASPKGGHPSHNESPSPMSQDSPTASDTSPLRKALNTRPILPPLHSSMATTWSDSYHLQPPPMYHPNPAAVSMGYPPMQMIPEKNAQYQPLTPVTSQYYEMRTMSQMDQHVSPINLTTLTTPGHQYPHGGHVHVHEHRPNEDADMPENVMKSSHYTSEQKSSNRGAAKRRSSYECSPEEYAVEDDVVAKRIPDPTGFVHTLEAQTSVFQKIEEDRVTYINKGQYYNLCLEFHPNRRSMSMHFRNETVKTVILIVLRGEKMNVDNATAWNFWYSRQHNAKQRVLELDTKNSSGIITESITEISSNAFSFHWRPTKEPVKLSVAVQCLSTDFSNQKGVKGMPLHIQVDTFEDERDILPVHRAYCQIKAFCDKGAERKTRDEQRRREAKLKMLESSGYQKKKLFQIHPPCEKTELYSMVDVESRPFLFFGHQMPPPPIFCPPAPAVAPRPVASAIAPPNTDGLPPPAKRQKIDGELLLYVRRKDETVFTALVLQKATADGLKDAIEEKFQIPASDIRSINKYSQKGIIVKVDDDVIRHYPSESIFQIDIHRGEDETTGYEVTLREIVPEYDTQNHR